MTRGSNRRDVPTSGNGWIDYNCPIESWEYWEGKEKFAREFTPVFRTKIALALSSFRNSCRDWEAEKKAEKEAKKVTDANPNKEKRLDSKQIKRELKAAEKTGICPNPKLQHLIEIHCVGRPEKTIAEKVTYILKEFTENPNDFLVERPQPKPHFTRVLFELFESFGHDVSIYSASTMHGKDGMDAKAREKAVVEPPFVEFVRRCIWDAPNSSASFCARVSKQVQRRPVRPEL